jgi:hypothetical protein
MINCKSIQDVLFFPQMKSKKEQTASKLVNDLGGMRKKLKLQDVAAATFDEIQGWL